MWSNMWSGGFFDHIGLRGNCLYRRRAELSLLTALPYLLGGFAGGLVGGKLFKKVPNLWLRRIFALFLLYGGWRYLFTGG